MQYLFFIRRKNTDFVSIKLEVKGFLNCEWKITAISTACFLFLKTVIFVVFVHLSAIIRVFFKSKIIEKILIIEKQIRIFVGK